ncbi:24188_t:CDS:2, partial [Gigaspora rosea]
FRSSNFEAREKVVGHALLESPFVLLELGHMLLESPFVQDGVIGIGACAARVTD